MSMDQAPENNLPPGTDSDEDYGPGPDDGIHDPGDYKLWRTGLPPHTDAAPHDLPSGTGLRLGGDWTRERDALRKQVEECESHNTELLLLLTAVREFCEAEQKYARDRLAQGDNVAHWTTRRDLVQKILDILRLVV